MEAGGDLEGQGYGARVRLGERSAPRAESTFELPRGARTTAAALAWCAALAARVRALAHSLLAAGSRRATPASDSARPPRWFAAGDVNAFFGLALDNITQLVILSSLLIGVFGFPADLVLGRMVPGTALGVLVGDLAYTCLARPAHAAHRARPTSPRCRSASTRPRSSRMVFGVLGPVKLATGDPVLAWKIGMARDDRHRAGQGRRSSFAGRLGAARGAAGRAPRLDRRRRHLADRVPADAQGPRAIRSSGSGRPRRAAAGRSLGGVRMPLGVPGALRGGAGRRGDLLGARRARRRAPALPADALAPWRLAIPWPTLAWLDALRRRAAVSVDRGAVRAGHDHRRHRQHGERAGGRRRVPHARRAADRGAGHRARRARAAASSQNTPYIGHPAYKAMGARAGYTLVTGLVIGVGAASARLGVLVAAAAGGRGGADPDLHRPGDHGPGLPGLAAPPRRRRGAHVRAGGGGGRAHRARMRILGRARQGRRPS